MNDYTAGQFEQGEFPQLEDFLCFATYTANLAFGKVYSPYLKKMGLTYTQWITLLALGEEDGQTVNQLGDKLFLASSTLTPLLKNLEKQDIVLRQRSTEDERKVQIFLTKKGEDLRNASYQCLEVFYALGLTLEETRALQRAMVKVRDNLLNSLHENTQ
ncbi:MAG TPA: MarR family transcriptional regulator [Klebsiella sp.]|jgi:DNA-binding MarR family transcriptional regulator